MHLKDYESMPDCDIDKELYSLIKAKYLVHVVTSEEQRVVASLNQICKRPDMNISGVQVWDAAFGLRTAEGFPISSGDSLTTPELMLDYLIKESLKKQNKNMKITENRGPVYVMCDMFRFLDDQVAPSLERKIKQVAMILKETTMSLVIVSPILRLSTSIEKEFAVLDYPLPGFSQLNHVVNSAKKDLFDNKKMSKEEFEKENDSVVRALMGMTIPEAEDALAKSMVQHKKFDVKTLIGLKQQLIRKGALLDYIHHDGVSMTDVGGFEGVKEFIRLRKNTFSEKAVQYGIPPPKGIFLLGVQGSGKSICGVAIANEFQVPMVKLDMSRIFSSYVGESEGNLSKALKQVESIAPCVLFVDEIDRALAGDSGNPTDSGTTKRVIGQMIEWMQRKQAPVFVVACANSIKGLPAALLRKGRFDELFFVDLPNEEERKSIFSIHIRKRKRDPSKYDLRTLVEKTRDFNGAEIESVILDAMVNAFSDGEREFETKDIIDSIRNCKSLAQLMKEDLDALREESRNRMRPANELRFVQNETNTRFNLDL